SVPLVTTCLRWSRSSFSFPWPQPGPRSFAERDGRVPSLGADMLQIPGSSSALKPTPARRRRKRTPSPFDVIDKNISPVKVEHDLEAELDRLAGLNDAWGLVSIYWAYVHAAEAILGEGNKPRATSACDLLGG